ncbi:hypothetical protein RD792_005634 [Penstemon davidsonii]|uniref:E3 ubiquitin-protein ligase CCNB1IP1 homolog n=1 Tax=Penstemon davidsonii TaxID=160366 RepID=A0ABR0DG26_9LAMI|nr:hypothetical protein RD792_005634 [Penstemon davidsonii]
MQVRLSVMMVLAPSVIKFSPKVMKSAYRSIMFYIGQKELEMQVKMNKMMGQCRQKCEAMQEKFTAKMEQIYTAYQKLSKRCQMMEQQMESLSKDNQELQEKFAEKCRQKRKLDEMYDEARNEIESLKRSAIQPANHFFSRPEPDLFSNPIRLDNRDPIRQDWSVHTPDTPGPREDMWPQRQNSSNSTFGISGSSPAKQSSGPNDSGNRMPSGHPPFGIGRGSGSGSGAGASNPSMTLRNLILSPIKRPQLSRSRPQLFTGGIGFLPHWVGCTMRFRGGIGSGSRDRVLTPLGDARNPMMCPSLQ